MNSKRTGIMPDKSYWVRSAVAMNCSAASSVFRAGSFFNLGFLFFIVADFLLVHEARAYRPDQHSFRALPQRERHKNMAGFWFGSNRPETLLSGGMVWIGDHP